MLTTDRHLVYFSPLRLFDLVLSTLVHFGPFWSTSVHCSSNRSICSILVNSIQFVLVSPFGSLWSIWSTLVHYVQFSRFGPFNLFRSIWSTLVNSIQFGQFHLFNLFRSIQSIWSILNHFSSIKCTYLRMGKCKFGLRILSIIWVISIVIIW